MLLRKYILTVFMHDHFVSIFSSTFIIQLYPPLIPTFLVRQLSGRCMMACGSIRMSRSVGTVGHGA